VDCGHGVIQAELDHRSLVVDFLGGEGRNVGWFERMVDGLNWRISMGVLMEFYGGLCSMEVIYPP